MTKEELIKSIRKNVAEFQNDTGLAVTEIRISRGRVARNTGYKNEPCEYLHEKYIDDVMLLMQNSDDKLYANKETDMI